MQGLFHGLTLKRSRRHGLPVLLAWVRGWHKKAAEIVQICFVPSSSHPLQLSVSLSVVQIMQGRRQRSRVRGCSSLRLASSFFVPLSLFWGWGGSASSVLPSSLCLSLRPSGTGGDAIPSSWGGSSWYGWRLVRCIQARRSRLYRLVWFAQL